MRADEYGTGRAPDTTPRLQVDHSIKHRALLAAAALLLATALYVILSQQNAIRALKAEMAAAQARAAEAAQLKAEVERLRGVTTEVQRLREESRELPRLRGDNARLRREMAAAANKQQVQIPLVTPAPEASIEPTNSPNTNVFTGTARATLSPGQTLVMGGWLLEPGKRTLALFTPDVAGAGQPGQVVIGGLYVQVPEAVLASPGWEQFRSATKEANGSGVLDAEQAKKLLETLQKTEGVEVVSSPRLVTTSGGSGSISIGGESGLGFSATLKPVLAADGQMVDLTVSNSLRRLPRSSPGEEVPK